MPIRLGIVGGGQLGYFLAQAARGLGIEVVVLTPQAESPATFAADRVIVGALDDVDAADRLAADCDVVTFEIESVAPAVLNLLATKNRDGAVSVAPSAEVLLLLQDKGRQKQWLADHGFPTSEFQFLTAGASDPDQLVERFGLPLVQKTLTGGYDGRGVQILRDRPALSGLWPVASLVEGFVPDAQELAVLVARGRDGAISSYQPASLDMDPTDNVLNVVVSPSSLPRAVLDRAGRLAERVVAALATEGVFAVELFVTRDEEILVNEISPRVHNAGHLTLEACETSQFAQQVRAVTGLPLGDPRQNRPAATINLLYSNALAGQVGADPGVIATGVSDAYVHWYGKKQPRPGRKMGHVTGLADGTAEAIDRARLARRSLSVTVSEASS